MNWAGVLGSRVRIARHQVFGHGRGSRRQSANTRPVLAGVLALVLAAFVTLALLVLFLQLRDDDADPRQAGVALAMLLTTTLIGLVAFDLHEVVSTLVLDSDLELLRRAPIGRGALFAVKLLDAFPRTSALLVILAAPAMLAFGLAFPVALWGWILALPALLALWAFALGSGVATAILLLRLVPARTAREVLGLLSTLAIFALWIANSFLLPRAALESSSPRALLDTLRAQAPIGYSVSPGTWVAQMMAGASEGSWVEALRGLGLTLLAAGVALLIALAIAAHSLETVQARVFGAASVKTRRGSAATTRFAARPRVLAAMLARDLRLFGRDWTVLGDILVGSVLWTLLPLVAAPLIEVDRTLLARAMLLSLTVALGSEIAARAVPLERRGIAWIRLAPVAAWQWLADRALSTLVIALPIVVAATLAVTLALRIDPVEIAGTLMIVLPALVLALAIGLWTGTLFGNFDWTHPRAMLTLSGRTLSTLLLIVQATGWLGTALVMERIDLGAAMVLPGLAAGIFAVILLTHAARHLERRPL